MARRGRRRNDFLIFDSMCDWVYERGFFCRSCIILYQGNVILALSYIKAVRSFIRLFFRCSLFRCCGCLARAARRARFRRRIKRVPLFAGIELQQECLPKLDQL